MPLLIRWLVTTLTIMMIPHIVTGVQVDGIGTALAMAVVLGVLNFLLRPILVILTLPLTVLTLGFFLLILNALIFQLAGSVVTGLHVASFGSAFLASLIISLVSWVMNLSVEKRIGGRRVIVVRNSNRTVKEGDIIDI